jgi:hypothetical protein
MLFEFFNPDIDLELFEENDHINDQDMIDITNALTGNNVDVIVESRKNNKDFKISKNGNMICFDIKGHNYSVANYIIEQCDEMGITFHGDMDNKSVRIKAFTD